VATEARRQQLSWLRGIQGAGVVPLFGMLLVLL